MTNRLELNWKVDGFVDEQRYYCSETPIDSENLPVPKIVLQSDVRTYVDTNIELGKTYHVVVGSVKNGVEKLSSEIKILAGTPWTPDNLSAQMYLDADDISSSPVASWTDRKTTSAFTQGTSEARPTLSTLNGKKSVLFDGADDSLTTTATAILSIFKNVGSGYLFVVSQRTGTSSVNTDSPLVYFETPSSGFTRFGIFAGVNGGGGENIYASVFRRLDANSGHILRTTKASNDSSSHIVSTEFDYSAPACKLYVDGTLENQNTPSFGTGLTSNTNSFNAMLGTNTGFYFKGHIAAIIAGNTALSTTDRQKLEGWAAHKYGLLASLPSDHPYKSNPPVF